ncbi:MAG: hypothetical protein QM758_07140 [Armatimonas sp.]
MKLEIDSFNYADWLNSATECKNIVFQSLDLTADDTKIASLPQGSIDSDNCIYLGCQLGPELSAAAARSYALIFPRVLGKPYDPFRRGLYTIEELFDTYSDTDPNSYYTTTDWRIYSSFIKVGADHKPLSPTQYENNGLDEVFFRRVHDNSVNDGLDEFLDGFRGPSKRGIVAIMGGHDKKRSNTEYRNVALLARQLTLEKYLVVTGGGPGLMEAANLGAFFADKAEGEMDAAIEFLAQQADSYTDPLWLTSAWQVRKANLPTDWNTCRSVGVPTWFYGHEPPNVFQSHIAKYFENSMREEGLLAIATHGVVFADGNAGTVQEIFQDACQNYYATYGFKSPMILFGEDYWDPRPISMNGDHPEYAPGAFPAWPLLRGLAQKKNFTQLIKLTSDIAEVIQTIQEFKAPWEMTT